MEWFERHYKTLFLIPVILLVLSGIVIGMTVQETGTFVYKGVTLSGGVSTTASIEEPLTQNELKDIIATEFPQASVEVRALSNFDSAQTFVIDAAQVGANEQESSDIIEAFLEERFTVTSISTETTGPSLGNAFFVQTIIGILLAFLWMGWVVFLYFGEKLSVKVIMGLLAFFFTIGAVQGLFQGTFGVIVLSIAVLATMVSYFFFSVPSGAVILAAASTIVFTLAVINLIGLRLSTAGVAAFLMLIGYSVDTDILLSTRVLKNHDKALSARIWDAFTTGITMQLTTTAAVLAALLLTNSEVIRQIMLIILIGMVGDIIFTWLQNAGVIYWFVNRNETNRAKKSVGHKKGKSRKGGKR